MLFHFISLLFILPFINGQNDEEAAQQKFPCSTPSEVYNACGKGCEAKCGDPPGGRPCVKICDPPACACAKNYARNNQTGRCVPKSRCPSVDNGDPTNPCAAATCLEGSLCVVKNGRATCESNNQNICARVRCRSGYKCVEGQGCVPDNDNNDDAENGSDE